MFVLKLRVQRVIKIQKTKRFPAPNNSGTVIPFVRTELNDFLTELLLFPQNLFFVIVNFLRCEKSRRDLELVHRVKCEKHGVDLHKPADCVENDRLPADDSVLEEELYTEAIKLSRKSNVPG